jgi:hypothetical protein
VGVQTYVFLTLALVGGEWSDSRPGHFIPGERAPQYPVDRRLGGLQNRSGRLGEEKILNSIMTWNSNSSVVKPVASLCTDCTILALNVLICQINIYILFLLIHTTSNTDVTNLVVHGVLSYTTVLVLQDLLSKDVMPFKKSTFKNNINILIHETVNLS